VMAAGYRVVAPDSPGFGGSDKPARGYTNADYARFVVALMDSLDVPDAVLVGHSMGGAIAAEVAIRFPQRVRGLALIGAAGLGTREPLLFRVARWPVIGPLMLSFRSRGLVERLLKSTYADPNKITQSDVDQYYAPVAQRNYGRALRAVLREFRFDALNGRLSGTEVPTLVLWGEADRWIPINVGRALAYQLLRSAFLSVPRAGHSVQEEAPDELNHLLVKFLAEGLPRVPDNLALGLQRARETLHKSARRRAWRRGARTWDSGLGVRDSGVGTVVTVEAPEPRTPNPEARVPSLVRVTVIKLERH
jgi:pimeloyl-ACP methyl ester carboxylesterase